MRSPKLSSGPERYYKYYAGYSDGFVDDMLSLLNLQSEASILDPWNGAGTTTTVAARRGLSARGYDINPAAVLIGRSRLLSEDVRGSLLPLCAEICKEAIASPALRRTDPLGTWFGAGTVGELRSIERSIYRLLVDAETRPYDPLYATNDVPHSSLASFFFVALFNTVRDLVRRYVPSNPAWIKSPDGRRLGVPRSVLHASFETAVEVLAGGLLPVHPASPGKPLIAISGSGYLAAVNDSSIDAVVTSPPYCTRLDYVKATLPELAVLGLTATQLKALRDSMIGTPTMTPAGRDGAISSLGAEADRVLDLVTTHTSRASSTYYRKYFLQYFRGMWLSLQELDRVLKPGAAAVLVVQDSFYKDVHVDLPSILGCMSEAQGWGTWSRQDFAVSRTLAAINPGSRAYRQRFDAVESALTIQKV